MRVSLDGGNTWIDRSKGLPNVPFWSAAISPTSSTTIFAAGLGGVYVSYDSAKHWSMLGSGLPNTLINQLVPSADGSHLFAFTYGRGIWKIAVPAAPPAPAATTSPPKRKQPAKCKKGFHVVHGKCQRKHGYVG